MAKAREYVWPFGVFGHSWLDGRLFYLFLNGLGFIFLLTPRGPILVQALDVSNPLWQRPIDWRQLPVTVRRDIKRTANQSWLLAVRSGSRFNSLPLNPPLPETFPRHWPALTSRQRHSQLSLGLQSNWEH